VIDKYWMNFKFLLLFIKTKIRLQPFLFFSIIEKEQKKKRLPLKCQYKIKNEKKKFEGSQGIFFHLYLRSTTSNYNVKLKYFKMDVNTADKSCERKEVVVIGMHLFNFLF
jgi:hypothetical protein